MAATRGIEPLLARADLHDGEHGVHVDLARARGRLLHLDVADDAADPRRRILGVRVRALQPVDPQPEALAIVVHQRDVAGGIGGVTAGGHPVDGVVGEQRQPFLEAVLVEQTSLPVQQGLDVGARDRQRAQGRRPLAVTLASTGAVMSRFHIR